MVTCAVPGCNASKKENPQNYTFHIFPKNIVVRQKWLKMLDRKEWVPKKNSTICSKHFKQKCFSHRGSQRVKLCVGSVPTLFMPMVLNPIRKESSYMYRNISPVPSTSTAIVTDLHNSPRKKNINQRTMNEETNGIDAVKEEMSSECRTCLQTISSDTELYYIFQSWVPPWEGVDYTIAEALEKLAQVQVLATDQHSKMICAVCCQKLHNACIFTTLVQQSDQTLRQRYSSGLQTHVNTAEDNWPKPIKINVNIPMDDQMGVEVKQEVLSDEEYSEYSRVVEGHAEVANMDIKIEPVELIMQQHSKVAVNGHGEGSSLGDQTPEIPSLNGDDSSQDHFHVTVKEEPISDNESMGADLSLDCMLCTKVFNSVSGLKAHVIAQHSYKSVRRKAENEASPVKRKKNEYVCATCRRGFATSTDLMVHETCHNKSVCYSCNEKFDSFDLVTQHRLTCKAVNNKGQITVKTLEDVQRLPRPVAINEDDDEEQPAQLLKCALCSEQFTDEYYMNIHLEIHHPASREADMEVEALESLFTERA